MNLVMKIKPEFVELIENHQKTIEFRKVRALKLYANDISIKGRITIAVADKNFNEFGKLIVNGYQVVPNFFKDKEKPTNDILYDLAKKYGFQNRDWIYKYWDWLRDYFKYKDEILIFNIEKFEKKEEIKLPRKEEK
ncbi:hypothetical protein LT336_00743 [Spiroplasma sp. JKS002671]|nr:hypothetical protein [Spiroplasma sp. JKS002671]MCL8210991.1 hypothetical protein [Spiroplasma sp. JKS002671]